MIAAGLGSLRLSPACVYGMLYTDFLLGYDAYLKDREQTERADWERVRWQTCYLLSPHTGKKRVKPSDLITFPWEKVATKQGEKELVELLKKGATSVTYGQG